MEADDWIRGHVEPTGPLQLQKERSWGSVWRVPTAEGTVWFKACAPVQDFEPRLTAQLAARHPGLLPEVLAWDEQRAWLLLADLGSPFGVDATPLAAWLELLPRYAELQQAEAEHAADHLAHGVPDRRPAALPDAFDELVEDPLPIEKAEADALRAFAPRFRELCAELDAYGIPSTVQHDDLHGNNLYPHPGGVRILDWGDASVGHPFFSLVVALRFVAERERVTAAYLEPWGAAAVAAKLALRVGRVAYAIAARRQGRYRWESERADFDEWYGRMLRDALAAL